MALLHSATVSRIANNFSWLGIQGFFSRLAGIILAVLLARSLGTADYGKLNICLAFMAALAILVYSGTASRATRLTAQEPERIPALHSEVCGLRLVMAAIIIALVVVFSEQLAASLSVPTSLLVLSTALLLCPALTVTWAFLGTDNLLPVALSVIVGRAIVIVGLLLLLLVDEQITTTSVVFLEIFAGLAVVLALRQILHRKLGGSLFLRFQPAQWGEMLRESWPISLTAMARSFYLYGDALLLGILFTSTAAALYLISLKVALTLFSLPVLICKASFPSISQLIRTNAGSAIELQAKLFRFTLLLLLPFCGLVGYYAPQLLGLLFGDDYASSATSLRLLLVGAPLFAYSTFQENLLLALPRPRLVMVCRFIAVGAHLVTSLLLIPRFGVSGAAMGFLVGQSVFVVSAAFARPARYSAVF